MHKIHVCISYQPDNAPLEIHFPGETADLSKWPAEDISRMEQEYRNDIGQYVVERIQDVAPQTPIESAAG